MKILITGSCGFIGTNLCLQLLNNTNNIIYGVDNYTDNYNILFKKENNEELKKYKNYHFYNENILGTTLIANIKPDIIIHLASIPGVRKSLQEPLYYIENNISAFVYLLEECKKHLYLCVKNRPDIHSDINNNIDIELLKCYMDSGDSILIKEHIFNLFDYINNKIQEFQSRHEDKTFIEFNKKLNEYKNNNSLEETVILYLKEVMPRLSNIVKSKEIFMEKIKTV